MKVHIAGHLRDYLSSAVELDVNSAADVLELIEKLDARFPKFRDRILDEHGETRQYINIFVNEENTRDLDGERTKLRDEDVIYILPSVAGG
jgi:MoaD family protein